MNRFRSWLLSEESFDSERRSIVLFALRVFAALVTIPYGIDKIARYDALAVDFFGDPIGIGMEPSLVLTIAAQVGFTVLLIAGLQTRLFAMLLAFHMAVATKYHFFDPFKTKVLPMIFLALYFLVIALGAGRYSADAAIAARRGRFSPVWRPRETTYVIVMAIVTMLAVIVFANLLSGAVSAAALALCLLLTIWCYADARICNLGDTRPQALNHGLWLYTRSDLSRRGIFCPRAALFYSNILYNFAAVL